MAANAEKAGKSARAAILVAVERLAREDPQRAAGFAQRLEARLPAQARTALWGRIGHMGALQQLPQASEWYRRAGDGLGGPEIVRGEEVLEWQVRSALRDSPAPDWTQVRSAIEHMPAEQRRDPAWQYWMGRARMATGEIEAGRTLLQPLADRGSFYGRLAAEDLGIPFTTPPAPGPASADEVASCCADNPGIQRALLLISLGLRAEGAREWNWQMRGLNDHQLLVAAEYARSRGDYDRMISTSERMQSDFDLSQRYPLPHRDLLASYAQPLGLDAAWVYGLIRQESRFSPDAHSASGALGLMQLMPATARFVGRKVGVTDASPARMTDVDLNLRLGTAYLKMVLDDLDGQPVLATAAYNAGPARLRKWRAALVQPVEAAIFIETIPIAETRDYVKRVMANTMIYEALLRPAGAVPSALKRLLGEIAPKDAGSTDLP